MLAINPHHQHLRHARAKEQRLLEKRREQLLISATRAARALPERWPLLRGVGLFGSVLDPEAFQRHSDLDLAVEGLPAGAKLEALGLVEAVVDPFLGNAGQRGNAIDLVRCEDLSPLAGALAAAGPGPHLMPWRPLPYGN
jgi:predicted nucleotidyltransferase